MKEKLPDTVILSRALSKGGVPWSPISIEKLLKEKRYFAIIFSHSFAETFAKYIYSTEHRKRFLVPDFDGSKEEAITHIQFDFLMEMVVKKEPLDYLEKFL